MSDQRKQLAVNLANKIRRPNPAGPIFTVRKGELWETRIYGDYAYNKVSRFPIEKHLNLINEGLDEFIRVPAAVALEDHWNGKDSKGWFVVFTQDQTACVSVLQNGDYFKVALTVFYRY